MVSSILCFSGKQIDVAHSFPDHLRNTVLKADHSSRLKTTETSINDQVNLVLHHVPDFIRVSQRIFITGQNQCSTHDRLTQFLKQGSTDFVIWHSETDGLPFGINQSPWHLASRWQNKCISARRCGFYRAIRGICNFRINTQIRQVPANQRKVVILLESSNLPDPINRLLITNMATQRIGRICWVGYDPTLAKDFHRLMNQPCLGVYRVNTKQLTHGARILAWYHEGMRQFIEFIPIAAFVAVYFGTDDIYLATAVLMAGVCVQVGYEYGTTKAVAKQTQIVFWVVILAGAATLVLQNDLFIKWKPTIVNWLFCVALLGSQFLMKDNLLKKMLGEALALPDRAWKHLAFGWSFGFFLAGALNIFVAYAFSTDIWVTYKLVGGISITIIYMVITMVYLHRGGYLEELEEKPANPAE